MDRTTAAPAARTHSTSVVGTIAMILLIVGGLNWGLVGLFNFDLVAALFGPGTVLSRAVYILVGLSALYAIFLTPRLSRTP